MKRKKHYIDVVVDVVDGKTSHRILFSFILFYSALSTLFTIRLMLTQLIKDLSYSLFVAIDRSIFTTIKLQNAWNHQL
ncbi:hypothetical protein PPL_00655 [Heterostelium album PN500]|uniref:Uncharacterized protein n=1 Tax=Heterostelium pallidum (strain ATCC 26659 / Pp 5 / PN500) TaxID=670386 RepID=D3AX27_HETP5|nr:hypothetical protein PPL_00655 [Heterostelium album PN500]EFA86850.1 hypothetical protein PPL_00655 [Heterostelium album PN500]|eukprot:XP_020438953.1 hypothetical protein PPL_00655 [Heterostelium album PN500]